MSTRLGGFRDRLKALPGILIWIALSGGPSIPLLDAARSDQAISPDVIALQPFVVYEGLIDVIDGFTGETYHEDNPVVEGFRENFNRILLGYHRRLLTEELGHMERQLRLEKAFGKDLAALAPASSCWMRTGAIPELSSKPSAPTCSALKRKSPGRTW